jgi:hypothetical protein
MKVILNWKPPTTYLIVDIYLAIELMKTMPAFSQLDLESKVWLILWFIFVLFNNQNIIYKK